jgi:sortase A
VTALQDPSVPVAPSSDDAPPAVPVGPPGPPPGPPPAAKKPREPLFPPLKRGSSPWVVRTTMFWLAAIMLAFALDIVVVTDLQYQAAQSRDYATLRNSLALATTPVSQTDIDGNLTPIGTPIALINIPRIGLKNVVVDEGTSGETLQRGPGHQRDTRFPGQPGVSILLGRAAAFGGPFGDIDKLRAGDEITVLTGQDQNTFRVIGQRKENDPITPLKQGEARLTLVTAGGLPFMPSGLVRVDATLVGQTKDPSVVYAQDLPTSEQPLGTMPETLPVTVLCLQALVLVGLLATWGWYRWGRLRTWIAFGPVVLLAVVLVGGRLTLLLPNLL